MAPTKRLAKSEYWRRMVDRFAASGLSVNEFCLRQQISAQSLYQWRRKLQSSKTRSVSTATGPELLPVRIVPSLQSPIGQDGRDGRNLVEIETPRGFVLRISPDVPATQITMLLGAIESVCGEGGDSC